MYSIIAVSGIRVHIKTNFVAMEANKVVCSDCRYGAQEAYKRATNRAYERRVSNRTKGTCVSMVTQKKGKRLF